MSRRGVSAILLAAGESRRMGAANKLALEVGGVPLLRRTGGGAEWIQVGGLPLGVEFEGKLDYQEMQLTVSPGDMLVLTSDGLPETVNNAGEMLGFEQLQTLVATGPTASAEGMLAHLQQAVQQFAKGAEPRDDMTIVVIQI